MRKKNIKKAAEALFASQGDDKNKLLATFIEDKEVKKLVKNQGRALLILERLCLADGKFSFTEEEMYDSLLRKLEKKGHRIQEDDEEDTEEFAQEKAQAKTERLAMVDNVLGKTLDQLPPEEETDPCTCGHVGACSGCAEQQVPEQPCHKDEFGNEVEVPVYEIAKYPAMTNDLPQFPDVPDLPDVAWQLIGQAYIDGIRTGRDST
jgi:hypothetical protein